MGTCLVVGATGHQGDIVARRLLGQGVPVRALVRESFDHGSLAEAGAELVLWVRGAFAASGE